jgi:hypothetical protein
MGATASGSLYRINLTTGVATLAQAPLTAFNGSVTDIDFNPMADRVRVFTNGTTTKNYRMSADATTYSPTTPAAAPTPGEVTADGLFSIPTAVLVANAYTNSFDNPTSTTLYSIDTTTDSLMIHSGTPQFNTIAQVGTGLGFSIGSDVGFDIGGASGIAYLSNGSALYTVNLGTGQATSIAGLVPWVS